MRIAPQPAGQGFAVIIVFVLLTIMSVYVLSNAIALNQLKRELRNVEKVQKRALQEISGQITKAAGEKQTNR